MIDDHEHAMVSPWMDNGSIIDFLRETPEANPFELVRITAFRLAHVLIGSGHS